MASRYWVGGTATWDATAGSKWALTSGGAGGQAVPTAADDVFFTNLSTGTCTIGVGFTALCRSINCTGFTATLASGASSKLKIGDASGGAATFVAGMTLGAGSVVEFASTSNNGGTGWAFTPASKTFGDLIFSGAGGKWVVTTA